MSTEMMPALEHARDAMSGIAGVVSCKVGLEANMSPADYPMIRVVPSRLTPGRPYAGRTIEAFIYFGTPLANAEGLEDVYAALSEMEEAIVTTLGTIQGRYVETITDEDRIDTYKIMAIRCELLAPDSPHVKCAMHAATVTETLGASPVVIAPFSQTLHNSSALDWTPTPAAGTIERLLNGAASTRTRITVAGSVTGPAASEVAIGVYVDGALVGNRILAVTAGAGTPIAFGVDATYVAAADALYDVRADGDAGDYTFTGLTFTAQRV